MTSDQPQPSSSARSPRRGRNALALLLGLLLGAGAGLLVGVFVIDAGAEDRAVAERPIPDTTLERIVAGPEPFFGDSVVIAGQVREIISPRTFTVGQLGFFGPDLLVATERPLAAPSGHSSSRPVLEGDLVTVAGEVRRFDLAAFERDIGADLMPEFDSFVGDDLRERKGDPVVRADSAAFMSRTTAVAEGGTPEEIRERPNDFYGKLVSVTGEVSDVLESGALIVDDQLVALTADLAQRRPREGDRVRIVGPVRPLDPDQLRVGGRGRADDEVLGNFANRPAVVAQSLETLE